MRPRRSLALGSLLLVGTSFVAVACDDPPKDCGTIDVARPAADDNSKANCFLGYHLGGNFKLSYKSADALKTYESKEHTVTITTIGLAPSVKTCPGTSQFFVGDQNQLVDVTGAC